MQTTAIVIGGSMGGLLAARVAADHFDRVLCIERDFLPDGPELRPGTPQNRHLHVLTAGGVRTLERYFPGLKAELVAAGAPEIDWCSEDMAWLSRAGWMLQFPSGELVSPSCSRELLEWTVRRRVARDGRVSFVEGRTVKNLLRGDDGVAGVRVMERGAEGKGKEEDLEGDLVIDASGRNSEAPRWLEDLGYAPPPETIISAHVGYASRRYRPPKGYRPRWKGLFVQAAPPKHLRGGAILCWEGDTWIVTLQGSGGEYPPTDEKGFLEFARSLRSPALYEAIVPAEPLSSICGYRSTDNRLRHYERLTRWPPRFVVVGDAVCTFNPLYAQGMTVGAKSGQLLDLSLRGRHGRRDVSGAWARKFQARLVHRVENAWLLATSEDYRVPGVTGEPRGPLTALLHAYVDRVMALGLTDRHARQTIPEVLGLIKTPKALFSLRILGRVVLQALTGVRAALAAAPAPPPASSPAVS